MVPATAKPTFTLQYSSDNFASDTHTGPACNIALAPTAEKPVEQVLNTRDFSVLPIGTAGNYVRLALTELGGATSVTYDADIEGGN